MKTKEALDRLWHQKPNVIRTFIDTRSKYEKLSEEVAYILTKNVRMSNIEYASITFRTKTLDSFCEKITRKGYESPIGEITDIAGVRIVYLYLSDRNNLESVIEKEFKVIEKINKIDKAGADHFGYGAVHYLVKLGKKSSGARYDDLKNFICEIQVRTILQDAWSIVAHHLSYKQESDVPKELRRKLNALSGLFETADDQFNHLKIDRLEYMSKVKKEISEQKILKQKINLDNLSEFLNWRLSDRGNSPIQDVAALLSELNQYGYTNLKQINEALSKALDALKAYETKYPPSDEDTGEECPYSPVGVVRVALQFTNSEYFKKKSFLRDKINEFRFLVKN